MPKRTFHPLFEEGNIVYFTFDERTVWVVRGFEIRGDVIIYIVFNPEIGEVNALENEISTERSVY